MLDLRKIGFGMFWKIDWSDISITLNDNEIGLPSLVIIPFTERYRARKLLRKHPLLFYIMLKQGKTCFLNLSVGYYLCLFTY